MRRLATDPEPLHAPRANSRAASNRRASSAAMSCFLAMPQHGIVAHDSHLYCTRLVKQDGEVDAARKALEILEDQRKPIL
jgi:hypothetical protein